MIGELESSGSKGSECFISYAQNYEDLLINRFFQGETGVYVDVGAGDPILDSCTAGLYRKGWHGLNLEPTSRSFRKLLRRRKRDINVQVAAGSYEGVIEFVVAPNSHESSSSKAVTQHLIARNGFRIESVSVNTLDNLIETSKLKGPIDLIKVDVEGSELDVLMGLNLAKHNPRLIVIEHVNGHVDNSNEISNHLKIFGYELAHFDSLNGFYVKNEDFEFAQTVFRFGVTYKDVFFRYQHYLLWKITLGPVRRFILGFLTRLRIRIRSLGR